MCRARNSFIFLEGEGVRIEQRYLFAIENVVEYFECGEMMRHLTQDVDVELVRTHVFTRNQYFVFVHFLSYILRLSCSALSYMSNRESCQSSRVDIFPAHRRFVPQFHSFLSRKLVNTYESWG